MKNIPWISTSANMIMDVLNNQALREFHGLGSHTEIVIQDPTVEIQIIAVPTIIEANTSIEYSPSGSCRMLALPETISDQLPKHNGSRYFSKIHIPQFIAVPSAIQDASLKMSGSVGDFIF